VSLEYHFADLRSPRVLAVDGPGAEDGQDVVPRAVCTLLRGVDIVYWELEENLNRVALFGGPWNALAKKWGGTMGLGDIKLRCQATP